MEPLATDGTPDSERIRELEADPVAEIETRYRAAFKVFEDAARNHGTDAETRQAFIVMDTWCAALHAARCRNADGLLPGPDEIVVNREALAHYVKHAADPDTFYPPDPQDCQDCAPVTDALSQPHPEETP